MLVRPVLCGGSRKRADFHSLSTAVQILGTYGRRECFIFCGCLLSASSLALLPGSLCRVRIIMTGILGIAGSFVGGLIARLFSKPPEGTVFHPAGILLSVVGAIILLFVWNRIVA